MVKSRPLRATASLPLPRLLNYRPNALARSMKQRSTLVEIKSSTTGNLRHPLVQSAANFLRKFRNSLTLDSADGEIFGGWREFAFRTGDRARSVGRAPARFGVDHSLCGILHSDYDPPATTLCDHHLDARRLR